MRIHHGLSARRESEKVPISRPWIFNTDEQTVLQSEGLTSAPSGGASAKKIWPSSKVNDKLDIGQFSKKIEVRYFDKAKGKGLIAKEDIGEREIIWKEDPFIIAPEW